MNNKLPISALLSALLATPAFAAGTAPEQVHQQCEQMQMQTDQIQALQDRINGEMQEHLARVLAAATPEGSPSPVIYAQLNFPSGSLYRAPTQMEKAPFLGIAVSLAGTVLREQLKLSRGTGLVAEFIEKGSPADLAGIKPHDVLEKLDDQILVNPEQFLVLVRDKKVGDTVTLTILHQGETETITAKLAEKELPVLESSGDAPPFPGNGGDVFPDTGGDAFHRTVKNFNTAPDGSLTRTSIDDETDISLVTKEGNTTLHATDRSGKVLFDGPFTTDEEKQKVPAPLSAKAAELLAAPYPVVIRSGDRQVGSDSFTLTRNDEQHNITLRIDSRGRYAQVKDAHTGAVIYDGPINSEEDFAKMPLEVAAKVRTLTTKATLAK